MVVIILVTTTTARTPLYIYMVVIIINITISSIARYIYMVVIIIMTTTIAFIVKQLIIMTGEKKYNPTSPPVTYQPHFPIEKLKCAPKIPNHNAWESVNDIYEMVVYMSSALIVILVMVCIK